MAGTIRAQYPTIVRPVLVSCAGRVSSDMIMRAFGKGADGVAVVGCYEHECNYLTGAKHGGRNVKYLQQVMDSVGLESERLQMHYCSAAEGQKFQKTMVAMFEKINALGPSPLRELAPKPKPQSNTNKETKPKK
ncbi:MAG: hydrogenase iron-sulfur subunit [Candidatus Lokiarchaeota archaeon]|nr:hydrogenase iron-sulfur subunit [Candidatus Lokiarchaeota archaeon]